MKIETEIDKDFGCRVNYTHPANEPLYTIENKAGISGSSESESLD